MPKSPLTLSFRSACAAAAAAARAANAVETRRTPRAADLKTLGIDEAAFQRVQL